MITFDDLLSWMTEEDMHFAVSLLKPCGKNLFKPDLTIAPDGEPYLFRWHLLPRNPLANVYFHIQIKSDPERPLHDHPWDNFSVILRGGYDELWDEFPGRPGALVVREFRAGDTVRRKAEEAHRLLLPEQFLYTMTLFSTGPYLRSWGYWYPDGWHHHERHHIDRDGISVFKE